MSEGMTLMMGVVMLYTSGMVVSSSNAVSSVIYLVGTIVSGGLMFMMLGVNLMPLMYVMVYVGGMSMLFLFVMMMVDLQEGGKGEMKSEGWEVMWGVGVVLMTAILKKWEGEEGIGLMSGYSEMSWESSTMGTEMMKSMGYVLYSENMMALIMMGFMLLMVMMSLNLLLKVNSDE